MNNFPRYESYKDTDVDWLGEVPKHWDVTRVKNVFRLVVEPAHINNDFELLSVYTDIGVKPRKDLEERGNKASTTDGYWRVKYGDIIVNKLLAWMGAIGVSKYDGVTSPAYDILRAKRKLNSDFYHYLFRTESCISELKKHSRGIMEMRLRLYFDKFGDVLIPFPDFDEQERIVEFLDRKTTQIDQAIDQKKRLIELLQERRQILIHNAVTRGLNANAKMKHSGVDWIGEIPEHWQVKPLRHFGKCQNGISKGAEYFGKGFPFVNYSDVYKNPALPEKVDGLADSTESDREYYSVKEGDIFFTRTSETIEEIGLTSVCMKTIENSTFSGFLIRFRPSNDVFNNEFSRYYFRSYMHRDFFVKEMNLVIRASLSQELLKKLPVLVIPLTEQKQIANYLDEKTNKIETAISCKQKEIEKLKEYKAVLINSAVTGKIKVSNNN